MITPLEVKGGRAIKMPRELCWPHWLLNSLRGLDWIGTSSRISRPTGLGSHARANPGKLCKNKLHTYANCTSWETLSLEAWHLVFTPSHREHFMKLLQRQPKAVLSGLLFSTFWIFSITLHHKPLVDLINKVHFSPQVRKIQDKVNYEEGV